MKKQNISAPTGMRVNVNLGVVWDWMTETKCHSVHMLRIFIGGGSPMADNHYLLKVIVALLVLFPRLHRRGWKQTFLPAHIQPPASVAPLPSFSTGGHN